MSESEAAASPFLDLPSPLPAEDPSEPAELRAFRSGPITDSAFVQLRRRFRESEDWRSLATLLVLYAASIAQKPKIAELCVQAFEIWLDRVKDRAQAAYSLARAIQAQPDPERLSQLYALYAELEWPKERAILLRHRIRELERQSPAAVPAALVELARLLEESFLAVREAILLYERALARDPRCKPASEGLIRLFLGAGAWARASKLIEAELARLDPAADRERIADLHLQLARIEAEEHENIAGAAVHLQQALKARSDDVRALRAFGVLYLGSGKASEEGLTKAADVFFRAAKLANQQGDTRETLKLLRRTLSLRPDHHEAGTLLAEHLSAQERWTELDDLYARWIGYVHEDDSYELWMQRGELLETHLARREEARLCYEAASRFEGPDGPAWKRLEELYASLGDSEALVGLLEAHAEQQPDTIPVARLLRAAEIYRSELHNDERASFFFFKVLEREPFNPIAFEGYKEHWRRKNNWSQLRDLLLYQVDQAQNLRGPGTPLQNPAFAEEFVELADICERRLGDLDGALDAWHRMAAAFPNDYRSREPIARLDKRIRVLAQLIQSQENELLRARDPEHRVAILRRLTQAYRERTVDPARAIDLLNELLTLTPDDAQAEAALAELYRRVGDYSGLITILRAQYEAARRPAQQMALVRQMAEIWQDELHDPESAIWACDQLVGYRADDPVILQRLATLYADTGRYDKLYTTLERELAVAADAKAKVPILRRLASVAEARLADNRKAARVYADLLALEPHNLDVVDKMAALYEHAGRYEDLAALLGKAAASAKTPPIRQLDYLMRLGHIAEDNLGDADLACSAFEKVLRIHRDHRGAVEALTRLYRRIASWHGLAAMLGNLQELVDTDEEFLQLGLERAEVLADHLDNAAAAARVLEQLQQTIAPGHRQINRRLLQFYTQSGDHRRLVRHAEVLLLAADDRAERRILLERIAKTWVEHLGDPKAGLAAFARYTDEAGEDPEGMRIQADLQELAGDFQAALKTLDRRLALLRDPGQQVAVLEHMAEISERRLHHNKRAMALLGKGLGIAPSHAGLRAKIEAFAARHNMWKDLLVAYGERFSEMSQRSDVRGQIDLCLSASTTALDRISDPDLAFAWAKKAYFVAVDAGTDARVPHDRLKALARAHGLWTHYLGVIEQELQLQRSRGSHGDMASLELLLAGADIARRELQDPQRAIAYLRQAHQIRPDDQGLARQIEELAEGSQLWSAQIELHEEKLARATSNLARFEANAAIARILEKQVGDPKAAIARLRKAWEELDGEEESLAEETLLLLLEIAEAHQLWDDLAEFRRAAGRRLIARGRRSDGLQSILTAARIDEEKRGDRLAALRTLRGGLAHDPSGQTLLPALRTVAAAHDAARSEGEPPVGALAVLAALQDLCGAVDDPSAHITFLKERAAIREKSLGDGRGACAEWLRVLALAPTSEEARFEVERLADRENLREARLLVPAWEIERTRQNRRPGQPPTPKQLEHEIALWSDLAGLYADLAGRPEYAFRARLAAWRLRPTLPPAQGDLGPVHGALWDLARQTGIYLTPQPPRDPLLLPHLAAPEIADEALWKRAGLSPTTFLPRSDEGAIVELSEVEALSDGPSEVTGVVDIADLEPDDRPLGAGAGEATGVVDIADLEPDADVVEDLDADVDAEPTTLEIPGDNAALVELRAAARRPASGGTMEIAADDAELVELRAAVNRPGTLEIAADDAELVELRAAVNRPGTLEIAADDAELVELRASLDPGARRPAAPPPRGAPPRPSAPPAPRGGPPRPPADLAARRPPSAPHIATKRPPSAPHIATKRPPSAPHIATKRPPSAPHAAPHTAAPKAPPAPPPRALTQGLPPLPELTAPLLPNRPKVHSAWDELALAYRELAADAKAQRADQSLSFARFYEEGPATLEPAFVELEQALALVPEHAAARAAIEALAARAQNPRRLIAAYAHVLPELTLPEHVVDYSLRLAALEREVGDLTRAEEHYRSVLAVLPQHVPSLEALAALYDAAGRDREYVDTRSRLLDLRAPTLDPEARVSAVLDLARDLETRLHRYADATRRIEALCRELPARVDLAERHAELLLRQDEHAAAAAVLQGLVARAEGDDRLGLLARVAALQEGKLGQPAAAITTWESILAARPGDPQALAHLQDLYLQTRRYEPLLQILDARLDALPPGKSPARVPLLVAKARALQEGLHDEEGATAILEALADEDPENDEVTLGLSRLYRRGGRFEEGIAILRDRLDDLDDEDHDIRTRLSLALAEILAGEAGDGEGAMLVIEEALAGAPDDYDLLQRRAVLARALADYPVVVETLSVLGDPDGLLDAAELARTRLGDSDWAARLYSQVLAAAEKAAADPESARRISAAIEGLVHLRLAAGDLKGADALIDDHLATIPRAELRARILSELGRTLWHATQDLGLARARFDAALREDPDFVVARVRLGEVLLEAGQLAEAEPLLEDAVESLVLTRDQENLAPALCLLARIFEATDRGADAYRRLTSALRSDPQNLGIRAAIVRNRHAAGRWREVLQALEPALAKASEGTALGTAARKLLREMLVLAADADAALGEVDLQFTHLERAAALADEGEIAAAAQRLLDLARAKNLADRAARYAAMLARTHADPVERGRALVEAGMLHEAAAAALADEVGGEPGPELALRIDALRTGAFEALRDGLAVIADHPTPLVERRHLEVALWVAQGRDAEVALACVDRLLLRDDLPAQSRREALLAGVRVALERQSPGDLERAYGYASLAHQDYPDFAAPVAALFDVLEAYGGEEAQESIERLCLTFFNEQGLRSGKGEDEDALRSGLLIRLAETQHEHPERAIRLLEKAASLDGQGLGLRERHHLGRLYAAAGADRARIRKNQEAILALDPLDVGNLDALARACADDDDLDQAQALYELLATVDPAHKVAQAFLDAHEIVLAEPGTLDMLGVQDPPPPSGGMIEVMSQLWKGAAAVLCERLPRIELSESVVIRESDAPWFAAWSDVRGRLSAPPYPLADGEVLGEKSLADPWVGPKCQYPPAMVLGPDGKKAPETTLRFAIGRALYFARPGNLLIAALSRETLVAILSATLHAFHHRHVRRRPADEASAAIAQNLTRKVPLKLAHQLQAIFKEHEGERFDSREWRAWVHRGANRVGLCACGELGAALDHLGLPLGAEPRRDAIVARAAADRGLRDLLAFAGSRAFAAARRGLGFRVRPR